MAHAEFMEKYGKKLEYAVLDLVAELRGSFSAEHGVGYEKLGDMTRYKSPVELRLMKSLKASLDPDGIMNPGKVLA